MNRKATPENRYRQRIFAWAMYDWANSAFATTILAALLPVYFSQVAGATLPTPATATAIWSFGLSLSLLITAVLSPILGTMSDLVQAKKRFLAGFVAIGSVATGMLVLVERGDWLLASALFIIGRIGFASANVFYDALLPHVARPEDQDSVSSKGYALGYLGGGLLLAVNVVMVFSLPGTWGARLSFLTVGLWWALFSIPLLLIVPEPAAERVPVRGVFHSIGLSFVRLWQTFQDLRRYRNLLIFLIAFLIYNDGIGTIIGMAAIYGAELGFDGGHLVLAILLVQFVGIPFSLAFGRLPDPKAKGRPFLAAFISISIVAIPVCGLLTAKILPSHWIGAPPPEYTPIEGYAGVGTRISADNEHWSPSGAWGLLQPSQAALQRTGLEGRVQRIFASNPGQDLYLQSSQAGDTIEISVIGQNFQVTYATGPDLGGWTVLCDRQPLLDPAGMPVRFSGWSELPRFGLLQKIQLPTPGPHTLTLAADAGPEGGRGCRIGAVEVLQDTRISNTGVIALCILLIQGLCLIGAFLLRGPIHRRLGPFLTSKGCIQMALFAYGLIAVWGFVLDSVLEFWLLAWLVAVVQGGSQALSRSLYAALAPPEKSGEFFGLFSVMAKFSSFTGPLLFAAAAAAFGSSRPAILSILVLFLVGGWLLNKVRVVEPVPAGGVGLASPNQTLQ